jgi:CheY-like chemotaxis protein
MRGAAQASGTEVRLVRGAEDLVAAATADRPRLIVVDLEARGDPTTAIARLKGDPVTAGIPVIAFAPHVREDAIAAARAAGADRVLARGAFVRDLPRILAP